MKVRRVSVWSTTAAWNSTSVHYCTCRNSSHILCYSQAWPAMFSRAVKGTTNAYSRHGCSCSRRGCSCSRRILLPCLLTQLQWIL